MNCERAAEHLMERLQGGLDERTGAELDRHLASCGTCLHEAREMQEMWGLLGHLPQAPSSERMRSRFFEMLDAEQQREARTAERPSTLSGWIDSWWPRRGGLQFGLAVATLVVGLLLGSRWAGSRNETQLAQIRGEVQSMTQVVALSMLQHQSASERLRAVALAQQSSEGQRIVTALLEAVNHDTSVNVRLAAVDALTTMVQRSDVRKGLAHALPRQTSAMMQVALAEVLAEVNGPRSEGAIEQLLEREELDETVRERLTEVLSTARAKI